MARKAFLIRIEQGLWDEIERWAQQDLRSANGQIEFLLREAVRQRGRPKGAGTESPPSAADAGADSSQPPPPDSKKDKI